MPLMNTTELVFLTAPIVREDLLPQVLSSIDAGHPSALFPYQNLRNKYYGLPQSRHIGRLNPPVGRSPLLVYQRGFGPTYQLSDEAQRQLAQGMHLANADNSYYRLAKQ
jgi:hypothetical protein